MLVHFESKYGREKKHGKAIIINRYINPIQDGVGGGKKDPPTSFSPVTSTNVGIGP